MRKPIEWRRNLVGFALAVLLCPVAVMARAAQDDHMVCAAAAREAAQASGVPLPVLLAISLTESGRKRGNTFAAWPWVMNIAGKGVWFESRAAALSHAQATLAGGETSFDMGCFQINYRWHGEHFTSLGHMLEPRANAQYAARFLTELYAETGNWTTAVGHYHSRTPVHAERYRKVFHRHLAALGSGPLPVLQVAQRQPGPGPGPGPAPVAPRAPNRFPLLQSGGEPLSMGSLMPTRPGAGSLFEGRAGRSMLGG